MALNLRIFFLILYIRCLIGFLVPTTYYKILRLYPKLDQGHDRETVHCIHRRSICSYDNSRSLRSYKNYLLSLERLILLWYKISKKGAKVPPDFGIVAFKLEFDGLSCHGAYLGS